MSPATEYCDWFDPCGHTTQPQLTQEVEYTVLRDGPVEDPAGSGQWVRRTVFYAAGQCEAGEGLTTVTQHALSQHWEPGTGIQGGMVIEPAKQEPEAESPVSVTVEAETMVLCAVAPATDRDRFWCWGGAPGGDEVDTTNYTWAVTYPDGSTSQSDFSKLHDRVTLWTARVGPGTYTLTCTIDDGNQPGRDDPPVVRKILVNVYALQLSVQYMRSETVPPDDTKWEGVITVAAGAQDTSEHKAYVQIVSIPPQPGLAVTPLLRNFKGWEADGSGNATLTPPTVRLGQDGKAVAVFRSSNMIAGDKSELAVDLQVGLPPYVYTVGIYQDWLANYESSQFNCAEAFDYDQPTLLVILPKLKIYSRDGDELLPIRHHTFHFGILRLDIQRQDHDGKPYLEINTTEPLATAPPGAQVKLVTEEELRQYVQVEPALVGDASPTNNSHTAQVTVHRIDDNNCVTAVYLTAFDRTVFLQDPGPDRPPQEATWILLPRY
jgi:hypothetical protein